MVLVCWWMLLSAAMLLGQNMPKGFVIKGIVTDEQGQPLPEVLVYLNDSIAMSRTDDRGFYRFAQPVNVSTIELEYRLVGYAPLKKSLPVKQEQDSIRTVDVQLVSTSLTMGTITVSDRFQQAEERNLLSITTMEQRRIDQQSSASIINSMQLVPGVTVYDKQPSIRGSSGYTYGAGTRVLTCWNGLPMINGGLSSAYFDLLPSDNIRQIEVIKGAASVAYGSGGMGGVINVISQTPTDTPQTTVRLRGLLYDRPANKLADWDGRSAASQASLHLAHNRRLSPNYDFGIQVDLTRNSGYRQDEFLNRLRIISLNSYRFTGKLSGLKLGLNAQVMADSQGVFVAWNDYPDSALIAGPGFISRQYTLNYVIDPSISYATGRSFHQYQSRWYHQDFRPNTNQGGLSTLFFHDYQYRRYFWDDRLQLLTGFNYTRSSTRSDSTFGRAVGNQWAAFVQLKAEFYQGRLQLVVGARYTHEAVQGDTVKRFQDKGRFPRVEQVTINEPVFRAGLNFQAFRGTYFRASWGQGLRSPSIAERFTTTLAGSIRVLPNPDIRIERGWTAEVGVRQLYQRGRLSGMLDVALFTMDFQNMVEFWVDPATRASVGGGQIQFPFKAQNVSSALVQGFEVSGSADVRLSSNCRLDWNGGITYTNPVDRNGRKSWDGDDSTGVVLVGLLFGNPNLVDNPYTLKYRSSTLIKQNINLHYRRWSVGANYTYTSPMVNVDKVFLIAIRGTLEYRERNADGWHLFDYFVSYRMLDRAMDKVNNRGGTSATLSFHVFNAFNEEFMTIPGTLGEQRQFAIQWKWMF
jgi:outer membrane receptor protein involved in Fe transport